MNIGKKLIFSSSITKGIDERRFRRSYTSGSMRIQKFPGARAVHFLDYLPTHLFHEKPDTVILQCGGNDLPTSRKQPVDMIKIAEYLLEAGRICKVSKQGKKMFKS